MDVILNMRAFLAVARVGSLSAAARQAGTVPSVLGKRIEQLEHRLGARLFHRSTQGMTLTVAGRGYQQRFLSVLSELDEALGDTPGLTRPHEHIRIKCPTTVSGLEVSDVFVRYRADNPGVSVELVLVDRSVNPLEEGFDLAIGALPASYPHVVDIPLCPLPRCIVASPEYIGRRGSPEHPRDLIGHDCIIFPLSGSRWVFDGPTGEVAVEVGSVFSATDSRVLASAARRGVGVAVVAEHVVRQGLACGDLVELLPGYRVPDLFMKALVPESRMSNPAVQGLVAALVEATQPTAPWDR